MYIAEKENMRLVSPHETSEKQMREAFEILELSEQCRLKMRDFAQKYDHKNFVWDFSPRLIIEVSRAELMQPERRIGF